MFRAEPDAYLNGKIRQLLKREGKYTVGRFVVVAPAIRPS